MTTLHAVSKMSLIALLSSAAAGCLSGGGGGGGPVASGDPLAEVPPNESTATVLITDPSADEIDTIDESIDLVGTADSDSGIQSVTWQSDHGAEGSATGTADWQSGPIPLELGRNVITVSTTDNASNTSSDTIVVNRENDEKGSVTLSWKAPSERADGSPLNQLAGYRIHYGRMSEIYDYEVAIENPGLVTYLVEELAPGDWYFAIVAYDAEGAESDFSKEVRATVL